MVRRARLPDCHETWGGRLARPNYQTVEQDVQTCLGTDLDTLERLVCEDVGRSAK